MRAHHDRTGTPPRERGRVRRWVARALGAGVAAAVVALAGGTGAVPPSPALRLTSTTAPAPPTNVVVTPADRALAVTWTASTESFITGYRVYVNGSLAASPTGTSATVSGLVNGTPYSVAVSTVTNFVTTYEGTRSTAVTGVPRDAVAPAAPAGVTATRGDTRVTVTWTADSADYDADGYRVLRGATPVSGLLAGRGTTSWTDTGLTDDTTYGYTVQTHDTSGNWSVPSAPVVNATPTDLTPPAAPTGLTAVRGDGRVALSWTANGEPDLAAYRVLRGGTVVATVPAGTTTYLDTAVANDTAYSYALVAVDTHGNASAASSPAVSATPTDLTPPAAPTGLTVVRGDGRVTLGWSANGEADLGSYRVRRDGALLTTLPAGTTSYVDTSVVDDTTYAYALEAVDTHGNVSAVSASVPATPTDLTPPAAPTGLTGGRGDGRAGLSWTANGEADLASYRVLRGGAEVATVPAGTTSYLDTGLVNDTTYSYALVAVDTHGNRSAASAAVAVTPTDLTPPAAPVGLAAVAGDGRVTLTWSASGEGDLASYRVMRDGTDVATVPAGTTTWTDSGLTDDTTYSYALAAVDTHGNRSVSSAAVPATPTDLAPPAAPTGLAAVRGDGQVALSWTANADADLASYRVLRDGTEVATVPAGTTSSTDPGLTDDRTYTYALVAVDAHGNRSPASSTVQATPTDLTAPGVPTGLAATRGDGRVVLTWTAGPEADLAAYRVWRGGALLATVPAGTASYADTTVGNDTTYSYALQAVDGHGNASAASPAVQATPTDLTPPAVPTGLAAVRGDGRVQLSWTAGGEADLAAYRVLRDGVEVASVPAGTTSWLDAWLTDDTTYSYALAAVDTHGNASAPSAAVAATPTDLTAPAVPAGLAADPGDRRIALSWTANGEADLASYRVLRDGTEVATVPAGTTAWTDTGLTLGTPHAYALVAVDGHGNRSAASAPVDATAVDPGPPAAPTGLTAAAGDGQVVLGWTASTAADLASYRVLRDGAEVATVPDGTTSFTDTGLADGTTYSYALVAVDTAGVRSAPSAPVTATPVDLTAPARPTGLVAAAGDGQVTLSWTAGTEADLAAYRLWRDGAPVATVPAGTTSFTDPGLTDDTTYSYALQAVDTHGNASAASSPAVPATPTDQTPPAVPAGLAAARGDRAVTLTWSPDTEPDLASYRVLRDGTEVATVPAGTATWSDAWLTEDTSYSYALVAVDTHGNRSAASAAVSATPTDLTPPAAPTGLAATPGDGQVLLRWSPNGEADLASYRVLRDGAEVATVPAGTTSATDTGLADGTTCSYALVAVDTHGNRSAASSPVTATPVDLAPPAAPAGLAATAGDGQVALSWAPNGEGDLASYRVLRDGTEVATVPAGTTSATDTGLTDGTTYSYALVAVDTAGNRSGASVPAPATPADRTPPAVPAGLSAVAGDGQVTLSWTPDAEADLASYRVLRDGAEVATVPAGTNACTDAGLTDGTTYRYALVAVDALGNRSAASPAVPATPVDLTPPAAPAGLSAVAGDGQVILSWTGNAEPDLASYRVLRDGTEVATVPAGTTTVTDAGLADGTTYRYALVAVDTAGNRSAASTGVAATPVDTTPPAVPAGLSAVAGDGQVTLSWTAGTEADLASYVVLRDGAEVATVPAGTTSYADAGLTDGTTYRYALVAVDALRNRSAASAAEPATPTDLTPPAPPAGLSALASDGQVALSWTANGEADLASYRVLRDGAEVATAPAGTTAWTDTGLVDGTSYRYALVAVDVAGNRSAASADVAATPRDAVAPGTPSSVAATPGDGAVTVSWTAPADADLAAYRVLDGGGATVATVAAPATSVQVGGLANGTPVTVTVVAVDTSGNVSPASAAVTATPVAAGVPATGAGESGGLAASSDGRWVVVGTRAQLEGADTNTAYELYLVDRTAHTARRIAPLPSSSTSTTDPTNTAAVAISDDGRYVALATTAALLPSDTNNQADVYRYDTVARSWALVSVPAGGGVSSTAGTLLQTATSVYATSPAVAMSGDGDLVLFYSARTDLVTGDTNNAVDLFAKRMSTGAVTRVSTTTAGGNLSGTATGPALALTPDGRFALFGLAPVSGPVQLWRKTLSGTGAGTATLVSTVTVAGRATTFGVYRDAGDVAISDDGRYVALSTANQITTATPATTGSTGLAYRLDTTTGAVLALGSGQTTTWEHQVELDPTGRYAFFETTAAELAADANGHTDVYRRDLAGDVAGPLVLVTADASGQATAGPTGSPLPAEYGRVVAVTGDRVLVTTSQALLAADTNRVRDLYAKDLLTGAVGSGLA